MHPAAASAELSTEIIVIGALAFSVALLFGVAGGCWARGQWLAKAAAAPPPDAAPHKSVLAAVVAAVRDKTGRLVARHAEALEQQGALSVRHAELAAEVAVLRERAREAEMLGEALHERATAAEEATSKALERAAAAGATAAAAVAAAHAAIATAHNAAAVADTATGAVAVRLARSTRIEVPEVPPVVFSVGNPLLSRRLGRPPVSPVPGHYIHRGTTIEAHKDAPLPPPRLSSSPRHPLDVVDELAALRKGASPSHRGP